MPAVTQLKVDDEEFLVASLIDRCPKTMMLRELVQNAIEAARRAPAGQRRVEIDVVEIDGGRKLRIWNTGPGMDEPSLHRMCDMASSIGKLKGLDQNFGMGAKVASLPSNHLGVRYRSCHQGRVHEVIIGKRNGVYGRVLRPKHSRSLLPGLDKLVDILEVTDLARAEGVDLSQDWTEVTLLGMRAEQDTAFDPYDSDPAVPQHWLPEALYNRYFRVPDDVEINISADYLWRSEASAFRSLAQRATVNFAGYECVTAESGLRLHYFYDPTSAERPWENQSSNGALQTAIGQVALVYRDEIYERKSGSPWAYNAPEYGITFGARNISIFIELPDSYPACADAYRQFVMHGGGEQDPVTTQEFAALVRHSRPKWLIDVIEAIGGRSHGSGGVVRELGRLAASLNLEQLAGSEEDTVDDVGGNTEAISNAKVTCGFDIVLLRDEQDINDRWLRGRAACFYKSTKQLFVNTQYQSVHQVQRALAQALVDLKPSPALDEAIAEVAVECLITRTARALLFAISKHLEAEDWHKGHIEKAMSPEALSIAADDFIDLLPWAQKEVCLRMG